MLPIGHLLCLERALATMPEEARRERRLASFLLGTFRDDVMVIPSLGISFESPSLSHFYPLARDRCAWLAEHAIDLGKARKTPASDYMLGRALHLMIDLACPVHAQGVVHYLDDPFETFVEANAHELAELPIPESPDLIGKPPRALAASLAEAARRMGADATKSPWGRWLRRLGWCEPPTGAAVRRQAHHLIPLAIAHVRALIRYCDNAIAGRQPPPNEGVLIIGAGPAGMALAACLKRRSVPFDLVDRRGTTGGAYTHLYDGITLLSPARYASLPGLPLRCHGEYISVPEYRAYLAAYAAHHDLHPRRAEVAKIERHANAFIAHFVGQPSRTYSTVVVATGMYDFPIWPDIPGLPKEEIRTTNWQVTHARQWTGPHKLVGKRVLIIGGATGAIEIAEQCARADVPVVVSTRRGVNIAAQRFLGRDVHDYAHVISHLLPTWIAGTFCPRRPTLPGTDLGFTRYRDEGKIELRGEVVRFADNSAVFADGRRDDFDVVVCATGYGFATPFLPPEVARAAGGHPLAEEGESSSWRRLYFLGIPCSRTLISEFLRGIARDAPALANRIVADLGT